MEYFDICDSNGQPTGQTAERSVAHREGLLHRTAHVWIIRYESDVPQVLLQKRSLTKDSFPGRLDTSSAGHVPAGMEPVDSAVRELCEELGICAAPEDLLPIGQFRIQYSEVFHGQLFRDNEIAHVYVYLKPVDADSLVLQEEELSGVEWHDFSETWNLCKARDPKICVPIGGLTLVRQWLEREVSQEKP